MMLMRIMMTVTTLALLWMALWEDLSWANVIGGVLVGGFVTWRVPHRITGYYHGFRPLAFLRLSGHFIVNLVQSSLEVAWEVVTPTNRINAAVVAVRLQSPSPWLNTIVANMNSLTPGTLTLELEKNTRTLFVHVLHLDTIAAGRAEILHLERLVMKAFPIGEEA